MISDHDKETAGLVLAKCAANDRWFPHPAESTILAWAEVLGVSGYTRQELLDAVTHAYANSDDEFRPKPAAIVRHAQAVYFERLGALSPERRAAMETVNHILQDMGLTPQEAHRTSRAYALGRQDRINLTPEQDTELRERLATRQQFELDNASEPGPQGNALARILRRIAAQKAIGEAS
ncbi:hypothetical protein [Nocardia brasiliensis]|uniref:hypothetical protein n=1 Tax=Nocardia brasiliensis TaxID=37326 RepID=UPI0024585959|nr:hypothetical protein [Nocardia brasiliensis]